jgi:hypothetical protein
MKHSHYIHPLTKLITISNKESTIAMFGTEEGEKNIDFISSSHILMLLTIGKAIETHRKLWNVLNFSPV